MSVLTFFPSANDNRFSSFAELIRLECIVKQSKQRDFGKMSDTIGHTILRIVTSYSRD
jgi:hypothetical protein